MRRAIAFAAWAWVVVAAGAGLAQNRPRPAQLPPSVSGGFEMPSPTELHVVAPAIPIPRNGSILVLAYDEWAEGVTPSIQVSRIEPDAVVSFGGTFKQLSTKYWSWTPSVALEPGPYQVDLAHASFIPLSETITIVDEMALTPPALDSEPFGAHQLVPVEHATCFYWDGVELVENFQVATRARGQITLVANLALSGEAAVANQFLYRAVVGGEPFGEPTASDRALHTAPYFEQAEEYCFGVEAIDIRTGALHAYPELSFCVQHGGLDTLSEQPVEPTEEALSRYNCAVPPTGFAEPWCLLNDDCVDIAVDPTLIEPNYCQHYFESCPDAERPEPVDAGVGGDGGAGGASADGGTEPDGGPEDEEDDATDEIASPTGEHGSWCSVGRVHRSSQRGWMAVLGLAVLGLVTRRWRSGDGS